MEQPESNQGLLLPRPARLPHMLHLERIWFILVIGFNVENDTVSPAKGCSKYYLFLVLTNVDAKIYI